ncbi:MAG: hypothetical protein ACK4GC_04050, partial [Paracoccaceae bacterium]
VAVGIVSDWIVLSSAGCRLSRGGDASALVANRTIAAVIRVAEVFDMFVPFDIRAAENWHHS